MNNLIKILTLFLLVTLLVVFTTGCDIGYKESLRSIIQTPDSTIFNNGESKATTGLAVTVAATKINSNTFNLVVTVNRTLCARNPNSPLVAYWTLYDGGNGKIVNLPTTNGSPCISGVQININYSVQKQSYVYLVLLTYEPKYNSVDDLFISNTFILTPDFK